MSAIGGKADVLADPSACPLIAKSGPKDVRQDFKPRHDPGTGRRLPLHLTSGRRPGDDRPPVVRSLAYTQLTVTRQVVGDIEPGDPLAVEPVPVSIKPLGHKSMLQ